MIKSKNITKQLVFLAVQELINHPLYARVCVLCDISVNTYKIRAINFGCAYFFRARGKVVRVQAAVSARP